MSLNRDLDTFSPYKEYEKFRAYNDTYINMADRLLDLCLAIDGKRDFESFDKYLRKFDKYLGSHYIPIHAMNYHELADFLEKLITYEPSYSRDMLLYNVAREISDLSDESCREQY